MQFYKAKNRIKKHLFHIGSGVFYGINRDFSRIYIRKCAKIQIRILGQIHLYMNIDFSIFYIYNIIR